MLEKIVPPELYTQEYYLTDCDGHREYVAGMEDKLHEKFSMILSMIEMRHDMRILDIGCGRGELVYLFAREGSAVDGIDYSKDSIALSRQTVSKLPEENKNKVTLTACCAEEYPLKGQYDYVFMLDVLEHMHDWQLQKLFSNLKDHLKPNGKIIITTPNSLYENFLEPLKRFLDIPFKFFKLLFRIPRGKYKPRNAGHFLKDVFRVKPNRGAIHNMMHCNVSTPMHIRKLLSEFDANVYCSDHSVNPISLLLSKWCGRIIIAQASPRKS